MAAFVYKTTLLYDRVFIVCNACLAGLVLQIVQYLDLLICNLYVAELSDVDNHVFARSIHMIWLNTLPMLFEN